MRAPRRLAILTLAAIAGLGLAACSTTVHPHGTASPMTQQLTAAAHTGGHRTTAPGPATTPSTRTDEAPAADGSHVHPDDVVPFLEQLREATDEVITEITAGADAARALGELDDPFTTFANGRIAAGIQV